MYPFYMSPTGKIYQCENHTNWAENYCNENNILTPNPDDYLLNNGWIKFSFNGGLLGSWQTMRKYADKLYDFGFRVLPFE